MNFSTGWSRNIFGLWSYQQVSTNLQWVDSANLLTDEGLSNAMWAVQIDITGLQWKFPVVDTNQSWIRK